ncbi:DUF421 domain-containing protein [Nocardioides sp. BP30]|uniref:DUF421 domain-containing protein n=1 Tax=Nocardioides sp. BP30 TaxID=3036374 RepID=UPI00246979FE|nr:YetF domain-containing protein [Nocardioides sp. BP30]WGL51052.1 DUF421 domain-containing protein [Nocardioides sp. BP30]
MEIVLRALVVYCFLWAVTRALGRSTLGELSTFQLLVYVTMGDLVQQAVTSQDYSVTAGVLGIGTFALLTVAIGWLQWRFPRIRPLTTGRPVMVWQDGRPLEKMMRDERLAMADFLVAAREQGVRRTADIEYAVLEADGRISFFTYEGHDSGSPETAPQT